MQIVCPFLYFHKLLFTFFNKFIKPKEEQTLTTQILAIVAEGYWRRDVPGKDCPGLNWFGPGYAGFETER